MKIVLFAASLAALAAPALAQTSSAPASTPPSGAMSSPAQTDPGASSATAPAAAPSDPKAIIASEFPTYNKSGSGQLSKSEFDAWMVALKDKQGGAPMKETEKTSWLKTAFTTADKDKSKSVSLSELTDYLTAQGG